MTRAAILSMLVLAAGCVGSKRNYHDEKMDFGSVQRMAVLPLVNLARDPAAADRVRDVLSNALLAKSTVYVLPPGDVTRALGRIGVASPAALTSEDVVKLGTQLKVEAVLTGVVREYGEVRSGGAGANYVSVSLQMLETATGKVVWAGSTTQGGLSVTDRLIGASPGAMNDVTDKAIDDLIEQLFR